MQADEGLVVGGLVVELDTQLRQQLHRLNGGCQIKVLQTAHIALREAICAFTIRMEDRCMTFTKAIPMTESSLILTIIQTAI